MQNGQSGLSSCYFNLFVAIGFLNFGCQIRVHENSKSERSLENDEGGLKPIRGSRSEHNRRRLLKLQAKHLDEERGRTDFKEERKKQRAAERARGAKWQQWGTLLPRGRMERFGPLKREFAVAQPTFAADPAFLTPAVPEVALA